MTEQENRRLNSWKEIADYLDRDVSTAMRWEKRAAMPVHRVPGPHAGRSVFAFVPELDRWLAGHSESDDQPGRPLVERRWRLPLTALFVLLLTSVLVWSAYAIRSSERPGPVRSLSGLIPVADVLQARDLDDRVVWTYRHPRGHAFASPTITRSIDLQGDGDEEYVVATNTMDRQRSAHLQGELFCFSHAGTLLWHVEQGDSLRYGAQTFSYPWVTSSLRAARMNGQPTVAWAVNHYTWWPGILTLFRDGGEVAGRFINSGWILTTEVIDGPQGDLVLVGGISNSRGGAILAVLDGRNIWGSSPETDGSAFDCRNCPAGKPLRYFVFPPSEVNRTSGLPYNQLTSIQLTESFVRVVTREGSDRSDLAWVYEFSRDLELLRDAPSDSYWPMHGVMTASGDLDHSAAECPEHAPRTVRSWTPENGWGELRAPAPRKATRIP